MTQEKPNPKTPDLYPLTETVAIPGGLANVGIMKHTVRVSDGLVFSVIEKQLRRSNMFKPEFELYQRLFAMSRAGVQTNPLPHVMAVSKHDDHYSVIMQYFEGIGYQLENREEHGRLLARSLVRFGELPLQTPDRNRMTELLDLARSLTDISGDYAVFVETVIGLCETKLPDAWGDKVVQSHNDLYFPNIATEQYNDTFNITYIDLGHVSQNHIGAEFHHFARAACRNSEINTFLKAAIAEYARLTGESADLIAVNAYRYALLRMVERTKKMFLQDNVTALNNELKQGRSMIAKVKAKLSV